MFCFDCSYNAPAINFFSTAIFTLFVKFLKATDGLNALTTSLQNDLLSEGEEFYLSSYTVLYRDYHLG